MIRPHLPVNDLPPWHDQWPDAPHQVNEQVAWGLGWGLQSEGFWHWGDNGRFHAFALGFPAQKSGIVLRQWESSTACFRVHSRAWNGR